MRYIFVILLAITAVSCSRDINEVSSYEDGINKALAGNNSGATKSFIKSIKSKSSPNKSFIALSVINKLQNEEISSHSAYFFFTALDKLSSENSTDAKIEVDKAVTSELEFSEAIILRAIINQQNKDYISAINDYNKALEINPGKYNFIYNELGIATSYLGKFTDAISLFEKATKINPEFIFAYLNLANTLSILDKQNDAVKYYSKALELDSNLYEALFFRANTYLDLKDYENAIKDYNTVISINPEFAMAYINRGITLSKGSGLHDKALSDYTNAINIYPWYGLAYYNRAVTHSYLGNFEKAIADYTKAIDQDPWYTKAEVIWNGQKDQKFIFSKTEYEKDKTDDPVARYSEVKSNRGVVYVYKGISDTVISAYDKASRLYPWYAMAYYNRAATYAQLKMFEQAVSDYNKALEINPGDPEILAKRAIAYFNDGNLDRAKLDIKIAKEMGYKPDPDTLDMLNKKTPVKDN